MQEHHFIIGEILSRFPVITEEEKVLIEEWKIKGRNQEIFDELTNESHRIKILEEYEFFKSQEAQEWEKFRALIDSRNQSSAAPGARRIRMNRWKTYVAAACVVLTISIGAIIFTNKRENIKGTEPLATKNAIKPGKFQAKLQLADGTIVVLESSNNKTIQQGNTSARNQDGKLVYEQKGKQEKVLYNNLWTANGETYATVLADGTKIWLNSQSSITYPVAFTGDKREVKISGEVYFEVAPSFVTAPNGQKTKLPFVVDVSGMQVEVLGTHFNINSYEGEHDIKTTLLEGKVRVRSKAGNAQVILVPGEQAALPFDKLRVGTAQGDIRVKKNVDVDEAVAWRYGYFQFSDADLQTVMRQLSRWYDIEVVYSGAITSETFNGRIPRSTNLPAVLTVLEKSMVHFRVDGKKIIVSQ